MHSVLVMTVLVARLVAEADLAGEWVGTWERAGVTGTVRMTDVLENTDGVRGLGKMRNRLGEAWFCALQPTGDGKLRVRLGDYRGEKTFRGEVYAGIYKFEGHRLYICLGGDSRKWPTSFQPGPHQELWILHRPKPKK